MARMQRYLLGSALAVLAACGLTACGGGGDPARPAPTISSVTVDPLTASIRAGDTRVLTAVVVGSAGASTAVTWSTEAAAIATVNQQGVVTGVAPGTTLVRATSQGDSKVSGTAIITVLPLRSVILSPATSTIVSGEQRTIVADVQLEAGVSRTLMWRTSASTVATVNNAGVVTGVAVGTATITAVAVADTTVRGTATVTVAPQIRSVTVTPTPVALFTGGTQALTAAVSADAGLATTVTWRTSNPTVATVSTAGVVTAISVGQSTVTAVSTADTTKRGTAAITVNSRPLTVSIVQRSVSLNPGTTAQLTANVAADPGVNTAVTWTSSTASVATVSGTGLVSGVAVGTTLITAVSQFDATRRDTVTVSVVPRLANSWSAARLEGPLVDDVISIAGFSATSAFAINSAGNIYQWNGTVWATSALGSTFGTQFAALHGTADNSIIAVGSNGVIARWNGTAWSAMTSGTTRSLRGVYAESATSAYAVGTNGTVLRMTGSTWAPVTSTSSVTLNGVWSGGGVAFIVGNDGEVLRYDGTSMTRLVTLAMDTLYTVTGSAPNNVVVAGAVGTMLRYDGTSWTTINSNGVSGAIYASVRGATERTFFASDSGLLALDGNTLSRVSTPYTPRMLSVAIDGAGVLWTGGQRGAVQRGTPSASSASFATLHLAPDLLDVWTTSATNAWAVGDFGSIYRWNGSTWSRQVSPTTVALATVWAASATDAFAAGERGVMLRWNGTTWLQQQLPSTATVTALWGSSASNVLAVTNSGEILRFNGTTWSISASQASPLLSVFGTTATEAFAGGDNGAVLRFNGTAWTPLPAAGSTSLLGIWASGIDNILAVGAEAPPTTGGARRYNGTMWQALNVGTTRVLTSIWGPSQADLYVTGDVGTLLRFNGTTWQAQTTGTTDLLWAVSGSPNGIGGAFAVGYNATIVTGSTSSAVVAAREWSGVGSDASTGAGMRQQSLEPSSAARASRVVGGALPAGAARRTRTLMPTSTRRR
ncbi:MAG TPA: Ig-like domain-containing protein [Gemmatimonas sp.]|nr:Ig-like domain-containing protein [Gemmatimonas sp.]